MAKGNPKNKNQQDRAAREAERRRRDEERAREREQKEAEKAREREEREREREEEQTPAGPPALVLASIQVFGQMPPHQLYVLTDGSTIATPDMDPALVESVRSAIIGHFAQDPENQAQEGQVPDAEIPVDPSTQDPADAYEALGDQMDQDARDEDGNTPEDYTALEGADPWTTAITEDTPPRQAAGITGTQERYTRSDQDLIVPVPAGMTLEDARWAIADGLTRRLAENQKGGI